MVSDLLKLTVYLVAQGVVTSVTAQKASSRADLSTMHNRHSAWGPGYFQGSMKMFQFLLKSEEGDELLGLKITFVVRPIQS